MLTPVVALATRMRSSASAPRYAASRSSGRGDPGRIAACEAEELHRLALELELEALVLLEDGPRAGAERTVVEEDDAGIEEKELFHEPEA